MEGKCRKQFGKAPESMGRGEIHTTAGGNRSWTELQLGAQASSLFPLWVLVTCYIPYLWENGFKYFFSCIRWQMTRLSHLFIIFSLLEICDGKLKEEHERKFCRVKCLPWRAKAILKFIPRSSRSSNQLLLATVFWEVICISSWLRLPVSQRSCAFTSLRYLNCWD